MKKHLYWMFFSLAVLSLAFTAPAFANKDMIYPSAAIATVNSSAATVTSNFSIASDGSATLNSPVYDGNAVSVTATWSIEDRSAQPGQDTSYPQTATFSAATTTIPAGASDVSVNAISNCYITANNQTCSTDISFNAPSTVGGYQVQITVGGLGGNTGLATKYLNINFSVAEQQVQKLDTKLTVAKKCFLLNQGNVDLTATLQASSTEWPIGNAVIDFYINPQLEDGAPTVPSIGSSTTIETGIATLAYNINGLGVGDHNLYAEFDGNTNFNPSNDSDTLGISYLFVGFRPPINADGTSIFGGRVIPIKIKLVDANGTPVTNAAPTVWLTSYSKDLRLGSEFEQVSSVSSADTGNIMRYSPDEQQYIYNWDASDLPNGTYAVVVDPGDSSACRAEKPYAIITVSKKGKK